MGRHPAEREEEEEEEEDGGRQRERERGGAEPGQQDNTIYIHMYLGTPYIMPCSVILVN